MAYKPGRKVDVPYEHWDRLYSPVACAVMITTVDKEGRVNAASFATCGHASKMKLPVLISTIGLRPAIAAPVARPQKPSSEIGGEIMRSPYLLRRLWNS